MFEQSAGQDPAGFLTAVCEQLAKLPSELWRTGNDGFADIATAMDSLAVQLECARVGLVAEAESRGVVDQSPSPSSKDWLMVNSAHLEPADAARTVDLAALCAQPRNLVMAAAVAGGTVTVRKAMTALHQLAQVEHALAPDKREEALASLTQMAQTGYERHVIAVGRYLMSLVGADRALEDNEGALSKLSSLSLCPLENGMLKISGQLDPEGAAVLRAALDPLSSPKPCDANGGRDTRPADRRRAEALVEICRRAVAAGGGAPATTKAQVVVTMDLERLTAAVRGSGLTLDKQVLSPQTVRKLACDASIIPIVLGSQSEPLDVGRTKRLVTPALLAALWARDKGCTYPGCGRPPHWCDAHHVRHWVDGGPTSLTNLALVCAAHHTFVHQHDPPPPSPLSRSPGRPDHPSIHPSMPPLPLRANRVPVGAQVPSEGIPMHAITLPASSSVLAAGDAKPVMCESACGKEQPRRSGGAFFDDYPSPRIVVWMQR